MTEDKYPMCKGPDPDPTPPDALSETYLALHKTLGNIERAVLTQPSVYGIDNSCMLDAVEKMDGKFLAVVAFNADVTDAKLEDLHTRRARCQGELGG